MTIRHNDDLAERLGSYNGPTHMSVREMSAHFGVCEPTVRKYLNKEDVRVKGRYRAYRVQPVIDGLSVRVRKSGRHDLGELTLVTRVMETTAHSAVDNLRALRELAVYRGTVADKYAQPSSVIVSAIDSALEFLQVVPDQLQVMEVLSNTTLRRTLQEHWSDAAMDRARQHNGGR